MPYTHFAHALPLSWPLGTALLACAAGMAQTQAQAQTANPGLNQKFWLQVGAFRPSLDSHVQVDQSNGTPGTDLNAEKELGLPSRRGTGAVLLGARLDERVRLEFGYFSLKRSASQVALSGPIQVGDTAFPAAVRLNSKFDSTVYRASAGYSFFRTPQAELGLVGGLHLTDLRVALNAVSTVAGMVVASYSEQRSKLLPLPTIGIYGTYAFAPNWAVSGRTDFFSLRHGDYDGSFLNAQGNVYYRFTPNTALALGYRLDDYKVSANHTSWKGYVKYRFRGPQIVMDVGF